MKKLLGKLYDGEALDSEHIQQVFAAILDGELSQIETAAVLIALKARPHDAAIFQGAAKAMLQVARPFQHQQTMLADCCGTGGDKQGLLNISTAVSFVVAACGVSVAKHGNRAVSSLSGSADVLEQLGVSLQVDMKTSEQQLQQCGLTFLFAPYFHPAIKRVMPVRKVLATRTVFNILGPLVNPARPSIQLVGVFAKDLCLPVAETLGQLGVKNAMVVHGSGLDEIAVHDISHVTLLKNGQLSQLQLTPETMGIARHDLHALKGGDAKTNAEAITLLFDGKGSAAFIDAVAVNAAAVLMLAGKAENIAAGVLIAKQALLNGGAKQLLAKLLAIQGMHHVISA